MAARSWSADTEDLLQVERADELEAEHPGHQSTARRCHRHRARAADAQRDQRLGGPVLAQQERRKQRERRRPEPSRRPASSPTMASTRPSAAVTSSPPGTSAPARRTGRSAVTVRTASAAASSPIGTLTRKIQRQPTVSVSSPPSSVPSAAPAAPTNAYTPIARARSVGSGNSAAIMPSTTADAIAAATPCPNRASTSIVASTDPPHSSEASTNNSSPVTSLRRRPYSSPSRPAISSNPPSCTR